MGFLNIFKKTVSDQIFDTRQFQMEALAFASIKLKECNGDYALAEKKLSAINLNGQQSKIIMETLQEWEIAEQKAKEFDQMVKTAQDMFSHGEKQKAYDYVWTNYERDKNASAYIGLLADLASGFKTEQEVLDLFDDFAKKNKAEEYNIIYKKGLFLKSRNKLEEALTLFSDLNAKNPFAWCYYQMAIIKNLMGDSNRCMELLQTAIEMDPSIRHDARRFPELANLHANRRFINIITLQ